MNFLSAIFGRKKRIITSFEIVTLHLSGMRFTTDQEIVMKDGSAEVSEYALRYVNSKEERVLKKRAVCSEKEILDLLNGCCLLSWDGFYGKHPKRIKDGTMFTLKATVNGDRQIYAHGSQNFPKHYRELTDGIYALLNRDE